MAQRKIHIGPPDKELEDSPSSEAIAICGTVSIRYIRGWSTAVRTFWSGQSLNDCKKCMKMFTGAQKNV